MFPVNMKLGWQGMQRRRACSSSDCSSLGCSSSSSDSRARTARPSASRDHLGTSYRRAKRRRTRARNRKRKTGRTEVPDPSRLLPSFNFSSTSPAHRAGGPHRPHVVAHASGFASSSLFESSALFASSAVFASSSLFASSALFASLGSSGGRGSSTESSAACASGAVFTTALVGSPAGSFGQSGSVAHRTRSRFAQRTPSRPSTNATPSSDASDTSRQASRKRSLYCRTRTFLPAGTSTARSCRRSSPYRCCSATAPPSSGSPAPWSAPSHRPQRDLVRRPLAPLHGRLGRILRVLLLREVSAQERGLGERIAGDAVD